MMFIFTEMRQNMKSMMHHTSHKTSHSHKASHAGHRSTKKHGTHAHHTPQGTGKGGTGHKKGGGTGPSTHAGMVMPQGGEVATTPTDVIMDEKINFVKQV